MLAEARRARRDQDEALAARIDTEGVHDFLRAWQAHPLIATQARGPEPWRSRALDRRQTRSGTGLASSLRGMGAGAMAPVWQELGDLGEIPSLWLSGAQDED